MLRSNSIGEIMASLRNNKLRTFLTGFSIAWGIFMLIVLLGMGNGVRNTLESQMGMQASNAVRLWQGWTSLPYDGLPTNRAILLTDKSVEFIRSHFPEADLISPVISNSQLFSYGDQATNIRVESATPASLIISKIEVSSGRFINDIDQREMRKVIVLHPQHCSSLFRGADPIGKFITNRGITFQVVGVYKPVSEDSMQPVAYVPLSTSQMLYQTGYGYSKIDFIANGLHTLAENEAFTKRLRAGLARLSRFDPEDWSAVRIHNVAESMLSVRRSFRLLNIFLSIIGLASMIAGIVGVGNIMYVTVRERTREIGIRKAIGASPASVIRLVIMESVFITTVAGYVGILAGMGVLKVVGKVMATKTIEGVNVMQNPSVDMGIVIGATLLLVVCGAVAGLIPALKAVRIKPIEAMKSE